MQTAQEATLPRAPTVAQPETGQRLILHGVSWATYESLLADFHDSHAVHFAYDRGTLKIMAPWAKHEEANRALSLVVDLVTGE